MERHNLTQVVIEGIANILGDTKEGLNGSEIHKCLLLSNIEDVDDKKQSVFVYIMLLLKHVTNPNVQIKY